MKLKLNEKQIEEFCLRLVKLSHQRKEFFVEITTY